MQKKDGDKCFTAVDLANGMVGVKQVYATLIPEEKLDSLKRKLDELGENNPNYDFQIRYAGKSKVLYRTKGETAA